MYLSRGFECDEEGCEAYATTEVYTVEDDGSEGDIIGHYCPGHNLLHLTRTDAVRSEMLRVIDHVWQYGTEEQAAAIWALQDGYGAAGYMPVQGYDWSGIRDSSPDAIEAMYALIVNRGWVQS